MWHARTVVIATGDCDVPRVPGSPLRPPAFVHQLHARGYRNPAELPDGGVLVVGAGPSGQQIAAELRRAGRDVVLAAGRHARMPRRYRGRDAFAWLDAVGALDARAAHVRDLAAARRAPSFPLERRGRRRVARARSAAGATASSSAVASRASPGATRCSPTTSSRTSASRPAALPRLARIDAYVDAPGCAARRPTRRRRCGSAPVPPRWISAREIRTIVWATGFRRAYPWLHVPVLDADGELVHAPASRRRRACSRSGCASSARASRT